MKITQSFKEFQKALLMCFMDLHLLDETMFVAVRLLIFVNSN